jgi:RNA polymerase sigma-70 factor (ECF subfamily)
MPGRLDNDHELIRQAQLGDQHAFGDLYEIHAPVIYRYLFTHLDNTMDAEDLTGEVFLKAWQSLPKYTDRGVPFLAFLFRIAHNVLVDHYRQNKRKIWMDTRKKIVRNPQMWLAVRWSINIS